MSIWRTLSVLVLLLLAAAPLKAGHVAFAELSYVCTSTPGVYRLFVTVGFDCGGSSAYTGWCRTPNLQNLPSTSLSANNPLCPAPAWVDASWQLEPITVFNSFPVQQCTVRTPCNSHEDLCEVTVIGDDCGPGGTQTNTECDNNAPNGAPMGFSRVTYSRRVRLADNCTYTLEFDDCCRSGDLISGSNDGTYTELVINTGPPNTPCNNPPEFISPIRTTLCFNRPQTINILATDPDGDSLVYSIDTCYEDDGDAINYPAPYNNPIPPFSSAPFNPVTPAFTVDQELGLIYVNPQVPPATLNPDPQPITIMCVKVETYRNGVKNGEVRRDIMVQMVPDSLCSDPPEFTSVNGVPLPPGAPPFIRDTICVGEVYEASITATDPNGDDMYLVIETDDDLANIVNIDTVGVKQNPISAEITYVPDQARQQPYAVSLNVQDDGCQVPQQAEFGFLIKVVEKPRPVVTTRSVGCNEIEYRLDFLGGRDPAFTWQWSGDDNLSPPNPTDTVFTVEYDGPGPRSWSLTVRNGDCDTTISGFAVVPPDAAQVSRNGEVTACGGYQFQLGGADSITAPQNYAWSQLSGPSVTLNDTTLQKPSLTLPAVTSPDTLVYTLEVSNAAGCTTEDTARINLIPVPQASISGSQVVCEGDTVRLGGPPNMSTYLWSTGDTTRDIEFVPTQTTTVALSVANAIGCLSVPNQRIITVQPPPVAQIFGDTIYCTGETGTLTALGAQRYFWDRGDTTPSINIAPTQPSQTFVVTPVSNNCAGAPSAVTVRTYPYPNPGYQSFSNGVQCLPSNNYSFEVTNTTDSRYQYQWNLGANGVPAVSDQQRIQNLTYLTEGDKEPWFLVTDSISGCQSDTVFVTGIRVVEPPEPSIAEVDPQCWDGNRNSFNFEYNGDDADEYTWNFGPSAQPVSSSDRNPSGVSFTAPGLYEITVTAEREEVCSVTASQQVRVWENPDPPLVINDTICGGFRAELAVDSASNAFSYQWYDQSEGTEPIADGREYTTPRLDRQTSYFVQSTDVSTNCVSLTRTEAIAFVNAKPRVDFLADTTIVSLPNATVQFTPEVNTPMEYYLWNFGDGGTSTLEEPQHTYNRPGMYSVTLTATDEFECVGSAARKEYIEVRENIFVQVPTGFSPNNDYQNDRLQIYTNLIESIEFRAFDRWGNLVASFDDADFSWDGTDLDGNPLPEGVYVFRLRAITYAGEEVKKEGSITIVR